MVSGQAWIPWAEWHQKRHESELRMTSERLQVDAATTNYIPQPWAGVRAGMFRDILLVADAFAVALSLFMEEHAAFTIAFSAPFHGHYSFAETPPLIP